MIRYFNFPRVPQNLLDKLSRNPADYKSRASRQVKGDNYIWTDDHNTLIDEWCKENICSDIHWGFQFMHTYLPVHKDNTTLTKLSYIIETGGDNVITDFFDENMNLTHSYAIEPHKWHILKVDSFHSVRNFVSQRFSITGRIFP